MSNTFKAPGSSRANKQQHNFTAVANGAMPLYSGYSKFLQAMQPMMNQSYGNLFNLSTQGNTGALLEAMRRQAMMSSLAASRSAMNMYDNGSLAQGAGINALNKGIDASNAFVGRQYDPATLMSRLSQGLSGLQTPVQNMDAFGRLVYGQPTVPVGPNPMDTIAQFAGTASGAGWI